MWKMKKINREEFVPRFSAFLDGQKVEVDFKLGRKWGTNGRCLYMVAVREGGGKLSLVSLDKLKEIPPGRAAITRQFLEGLFQKAKIEGGKHEEMLLVG